MLTSIKLSHLLQFTFKSLLFICFVFSIENQAFAQEGENSASGIPEIESLIDVPKSPEARAFQKYGSSEIDFYSGSPGISLPVHAIQGRGITIPIELTYDASGIKVNQVASSVGLGWNLRIGGMVVRQVFGKPDDYLSASPLYLPFHSPSVREDFNFVLNSSIGIGTISAKGEAARYFNYLREWSTKQNRETQPDLYSFSVNNLSGTFYIDYDNNIGRCIENPDIVIIPAFGSYETKVVIGWTIIDPSGTTYEFSNPETTYVYDENRDDHFRHYYSAWNLLRITTANRRDVITFQYDESRQWLQPQEWSLGEVKEDSEIINGIRCSNGYYLTAPQSYRISQANLVAIHLNGNTAATIGLSPEDRRDLSGRRSIAYIRFVNHLGEMVKEVRFHHSYFESFPKISEEDFRLCLDSLTFLNSDKGVEQETYRFTYDKNNELPSRNSLSQDFWGYYSGKTSNTLIPFVYDADYNSPFKGADRRPDLRYATAAILHSIEYPTKGKTSYHYKLNRSNDKSFVWDEEIYPLSLQLNGGTDTNDPLKYMQCGDDLGGGPPNGISLDFYIDDAQSYDLSLDAFRSEGSINYGPQLAVIYFVSDEKFPNPCSTLSNGQVLCIEPRSTCELITSNSVIFRRYGNGLQSEKKQLHFAKGTYRVVLLNGSQGSQVSVLLKSRKTTESKNVGGLRVYKIVDDPIVGEPVVRYFHYNDLSMLDKQLLVPSYFEADSGETSGVVHEQVELGASQFSEFCTSDSTTAQILECRKLVRSGSVVGGSGRNLISYSTVSEISFKDSIPQGFVVFRFHNESDNFLRSRPTPRRSHLNGKLIDKTVYNANGDMLERTSNYYSQTFVQGIKGFSFYGESVLQRCLGVTPVAGNPNTELVALYTQLCQSSSSLVPSCEQADFTYYQGSPFTDYQKWVYSLSQYRIRLDSSVTKVKEFTSVELVKAARFRYGSTLHNLVTERTEVDSNGDTLRTKYHYPTDVVQTAAINKLITQNRKHEVVKSEVLRNSQIVYEYETEYEEYPDGRVLPIRVVYDYGRASDSKTLHYLEYDVDSNPLCVQFANDLPTTFVWGHINSKMIAKVSNAFPSGVFHTSFEESGVRGNEIKAKTGDRYFAGSTYSIPAEQRPSAGDLVMTFWYFDLKWKFSSIRPYSPMIVEPGASAYDEIRVFPRNALMSTFTHHPDVGVSSVTDANNITLHYEYDALNRVKATYDHNRFLTELIEYGFKK